MSKRWATYRAYKFNFTGLPTEPPTVKALVYWISVERATTVIFVSWIEGTEVVRWIFVGSGSKKLLLGEKKKPGLEISF